jgi:uncharacterized protein YozE (UPF0346 family)
MLILIGKMKKCNPQEIIRKIPNIQSLMLPMDWFNKIPENTSVFNSLYNWMLTDGKVVSVRDNEIHNRTYVGEKLYNKLLSEEKKRIRRTRHLKGDELEKAVFWSDLGNGPQYKIGECVIAGDVLLVMPEKSDSQLNSFCGDVDGFINEEKIRRIKKYAAGGSFYEWLIFQKERPDIIGDLAKDVYFDKYFPRDLVFFEEIKRYLEKQGACIGAIDSLKEAWLEYIHQYPERVTPSAWCSECGGKVELDNAVLVYDAEGLELCVLDKECCVDYLRCGEFSCVLLQEISPIKLEDLVEKDGFSKYDVEELEKQLKLWGIISLNNDKGTIYFIKSDETKEIKIGYTSGEVEKRLKTLQTGHPYKLQVLATMPGSRDEEKTLHEKFASIRLSGEWFKPHPDLLAFIATVKKL